MNGLSTLKKSMKAFFSCLLLGSLLMAGCHKNKEKEDAFLKAKVVITKDLSCGVPVIDFSEDSVRIRQLTGIKDLRFTAINLPTQFIVQDKKIGIMVSVPGPSEDYLCTAVGVWYPHLKTLAVKDRQ